MSEVGIFGVNSFQPSGSCTACTAFKANSGGKAL